MINVNRHIRDLLQEHECLIVPKMGGFVTYTRSEESDEKHPEDAGLFFNSFLDYNDGVLADHIAHTEDVPYHEALKEIEWYVDDCLGQLAAGKKVVIEQVGVFSQDASKNIRFESVRSKAMPAAGFVLSGEPTVAETEPDSAENNTHLFGKLLGAVVLCLTALGLYTSVYQRQLSDSVTYVPNSEPAYVRSSQAELKSESNYPVVSTTIVGSAGRSTSGVSSKDASARSSNEANVKASTAVTSRTYHTIAGSFSTEKAANRKAKELEAGGYTDVQILTPGPARYLVSLQHFASLEAAKASVEQLGRKGMDTWIFRR